ncbi:hypothetical protein M472_14940 [Sphingobacterium paucimobilis HER1398]|uniref:Uncharacterized protein n=1 Tax=Sphingobacterium paucimobilis HER1398 TaxID=1346330 RepID=U2JBP6_9SPHI|nr:hypothetical protein M472_14940 [Sphingobacterium paucimobilis HER1398]
MFIVCAFTIARELIKKKSAIICFILLFSKMFYNSIDKEKARMFNIVLKKMITFCFLSIIFREINKLK